MELVSSNSETAPRTDIFKIQFKRYKFKTEQIVFKFDSEASIIFSIINTNFKSFRNIFLQLKIEDLKFLSNIQQIKFYNLIANFKVISGFKLNHRSNI